jgi:hypothetical protein
MDFGEKKYGEKNIFITWHFSEKVQQLVLEGKPASWSYLYMRHCMPQTFPPTLNFRSA